jgi:hypothetical protein
MGCFPVPTLGRPIGTGEKRQVILHNPTSRQWLFSKKLYKTTGCWFGTDSAYQNPKLIGLTQKLTNFSTGRKT